MQNGRYLVLHTRIRLVQIVSLLLPNYFTLHINLWGLPMVEVEPGVRSNRCLKKHLGRLILPRHLNEAGEYLQILEYELRLSCYRL